MMRSELSEMLEVVDDVHQAREGGSALLTDTVQGLGTEVTALALDPRLDGLATVPSVAKPSHLSRLSVDGLEDDGVAGLRVVADNLAEAWITAVDKLMQPGIQSIEPLVVTVIGFDAEGRPQESPAVTSLIDAELRAAHEARAEAKGTKPKHGPLTVATAANTIFPESLWNPRMSRHEFYAKYMQMLPRLKRDSRNKRGIYFERLIAYGRGPNGGNQLEHMFQAFARGVKRTSAYQATIADPQTDLTKTPLLGFPCLQQIAVHPSEKAGTLAITGFYGTQYVFERGYGNYLGLARLGRFLAHEMGLRFTRMTCVASYAPVEGLGKTRGRNLIAAARRAMAAERMRPSIPRADNVTQATSAIHPTDANA